MVVRSRQMQFPHLRDDSFGLPSFGLHALATLWTRRRFHRVGRGLCGDYVLCQRLSKLASQLQDDRFNLAEIWTFRPVGPFQRLLNQFFRFRQQLGSLFGAR